MSKNSFFSGQPIFSQIINLLPKHFISTSAVQFKSDHYCKKFNTYHHLLTMLYTTFQSCTSLREVVTGMRACQGRLQPLGLQYLPARSTFAEANKRRSYEVFEHIYNCLYSKYGDFLSDSCSKNELKNRLILIDSTTISLFKEVLKNAGRKDQNGKRKGGIKVHMAVPLTQNIPQLIKLTPAACHDAPFMKQLSPAPGSILVMDMAYQNFSVLNNWMKEQIHWVTRLKNSSVVEVLSQNNLSDEAKNRGVISDQLILLGTPNRSYIERVRCRLVEFYDVKNKKRFSFITSIENMDAITIADIYKQRWQIEVLFKRLKQNMPLDYFLGDNENAIKVQIYCALIADLLLQVLKKKIKRGWAYSNLVSFIRLHLMNYTNVYKFLENPDKCKIENPPLKAYQLKLFQSG